MRVNSNRCRRETRALIDLALLRRILMNSDMFYTGCMHEVKIIMNMAIWLNCVFLWGNELCLDKLILHIYHVYMIVIHMLPVSRFNRWREIPKHKPVLCNRSRPNKLNKFFPNCFSTTNGVASALSHNIQDSSPKPSAPSQVFLKFEQPVQNSPIQYHKAIKS
jgi:hypothetical protein